MPLLCVQSPPRCLGCGDVECWDPTITIRVASCRIASSTESLRVWAENVLLLCACVLQGAVVAFERVFGPAMTRCEPSLSVATSEYAARGTVVAKQLASRGQVLAAWAMDNVVRHAKQLMELIQRMREERAREIAGAGVGTATPPTAAAAATADVKQE
jgi:hypothetical protein